MMRLMCIFFFLKLDTCLMCAFTASRAPELRGLYEPYTTSMLSVLKPTTESKYKGSETAADLDTCNAETSRSALESNLVPLSRVWNKMNW